MNCHQQKREVKLKQTMFCWLYNWIGFKHHKTIHLSISYWTTFRYFYIRFLISFSIQISFLVKGKGYMARRRRQWLYCCNFVQNLHRRCLPIVQHVSIFCHVSYVGGDQVMSQQVIRQHVPHATKLSTLRLHSSSGTRAPLQHMSPPYCQNIYSSLSLTSSSLIKILMSIAKSWNSSCQTSSSSPWVWRLLHMKIIGPFLLYLFDTPHISVSTVANEVMKI